MIAGIDPGVTGAIALLNDDLSFFDVRDMPTMPLSKTKEQVNPAALSNFLNIYAMELRVVYIEQVSAMPGQGVTSMFNFGVSYGVVRGVCAGHYLSVRLVKPQEWKEHYHLTGKDKPKDLSRTVAQQLYPTAELFKKKDVGRADALLIARYGGQYV